MDHKHNDQNSFEHSRSKTEETGCSYNPHPSKFGSDLKQHDRPDQRKDEKTIIVLVNPHSGKGKSLSIYNEKILTYFNDHNISHQVFVTESDQRVNDFIKSKTLKELTDYRTILVVSGDGLLHETINAIMNRPDWEKAINIPIGIIPTGSGNGLAYTLIRQRYPDLNNFDEVLNLCLDQAVSCTTCEADLVKITYGRTKTIWSFLSIGWGLLADIDIDSEWLRPLGEFRFTIYGLLRSVTSVSYEGKLSYRKMKRNPLNAQEVDDSTPDELGEDSDTVDNSGPDSEDPKDNEEDDWVHLEGKFACLYAVHQSYVSRVTKFAPKSTLTDQMIYLTYIRGKLTVCRVIEFLLAIEDGSHEQLPYVSVVPVTEFKFQPLESGKVVVDGEVIPWTLADGPIMAGVVPKVMKLRWDIEK